VRRSLAVLPLAALAAYSVAIGAIELGRGTAAVRPLLEDPAGAVRWAGVHTALSTGLLWVAAALILAARRWTPSRPGDRGPARFLAIQFALLVLLGFDERFRLGPSLVGHSRPALAATYGALGLAEAALLLGPGRLLAGPASVAGWALLAAASYGAALAGELFLPAGMRLHQTLEDMPKLWGGCAIARFAWLRMVQAVETQRARREAGGRAPEAPADAFPDADVVGWAREAGTWGEERSRADAPTPRLTELARPDRTPPPEPVRPGPPGAGRERGARP
jgi:hypothetical protein